MQSRAALYIDESEVLGWLRTAAEVASDFPLVDLHVHAGEVVFGALPHAPTPDPGRWSVPGSSFAPARPARIRIDGADPEPHGSALRNRLSRALFTRAYEHVGHSVLRAEMAIAHMSGALLLPVAGDTNPETVDTQMDLLARCAKGQPGLWTAYSVPRTVPTDAIASHLRQVVRLHAPRAIKLHPNLSGIDLRTAAGIEHVERLLEACRELGLPLVVHGGRSPILGDVPAARFATIENLSLVDWRRSRVPVVIAHFAAYGCASSERVERVRPALARLLAAHDLLYTDCSGLSLPALLDVLPGLDPQRIVFGSDALYTPMWAALATFLHGAHACGRSAHETLRQTAHANPRRILGWATSPGSDRTPC
jgi:predicted TIM-barrel fold metal-dependent hydrolase